MGNTSSALQQCLSTALAGNSSLVAYPSNPLYQLIDVHAYNLNIPVDPVAITYPTSAEQVSGIINCATASGLKVQARSGGHSYGNYGLGGGQPNTLTIDLENMQQFSMNTTDWTAWIGAGTQLGDVSSKLLANGNRAMAHGTCPQVGIGGHATIGGLGPMSRMWGAALDHIIEAEVVLADGSIVTASETQNPDVFFAIKGAGASFGVVTQFKVITHPAPGSAVQYAFTFAGGPFSGTPAQLFKNWQAFVSNPNLSWQFASEFIVSSIGTIISGTFFGTQEEFNAMNITSAFPGSSNTSVVTLEGWEGIVTNWFDNAAQELGGGVPSSFYSKSLAFSPTQLLSDSTVDSMMEYFDDTDTGALLWFVIFDLEGGYTSSIPSNATAYAHRDTLYWLQSYAVDIVSVSSTTTNFLDGLNNLLIANDPTVAGTAYPGYVDPQLANGQAAYWASNLPRLESIKAEIDPRDVFHNPQSVPLP